MSFSRLEKYLRDNPVVLPSGTQDRQVIVVSDSKGRYLQRQIQNIRPENNIIWQAVGGRTTLQATNYILANIHSYLHKYGNILLIVWTGTCDLTRKTNRFVDLSGTAIDDIIFQYEKVFNLNTRFGDRVKVLVLEVPYYSVSIWNFHKGHPDQTAFQETDKILFNRISDLNERIKSLNQSHGVVSPRFSADLIRCRKSNKNHPSKSVSYSLLLDGIHPSVTLSKYWIRRLVLSVICKLCFH